MLFVKPTLLFLLAGVRKIGNGYLMWHWLKGRYPLAVNAYSPRLSYGFGQKGLSAPAFQS